MAGHHDHLQCCWADRRCRLLLDDEIVTASQVVDDDPLVFVDQAIWDEPGVFDLAVEEQQHSPGSIVVDDEIVEDNARIISSLTPPLASSKDLFFSSNRSSCDAKSFPVTAPPPDHRELLPSRSLLPAANLLYQYASKRAAAAMAAAPLEEESSSRPKRRNTRISSDPQSVAARHRRERISQKIRTLQRLVPGGTKMDTASMLDEAINYVKFLKNQVLSLELLGFQSQAAAPNPSFHYLPIPLSIDRNFVPVLD